MNDVETGILLSFEGGEGCGKSTQASRLIEHLLRLSIEAVIVKNPGGTKIGNEVRKILLNPENTTISSKAEVFLHAASLRQSYEDVIIPSLEKGKIVIADRYIDSALVYQGIVRKAGIPFVQDVIITKALDNCLPDLTLFFDMPGSIVHERTNNRSYEEARVEMEEISFHEQIRKAYLDIATKEPERVKIIDATLPIDDVTNQMIEVVTEYLRTKNLC